MTHLFTKFLLAAMIRSLMSCKTNKERVTLPWGEYVKRVAPPGGGILLLHCPYVSPTVLLSTVCICHLFKLVGLLTFL